MAALGHIARLWQIAQGLGSYDVLLPREIAARYPWHLRLVRGLFSSKAEGPVGLRLTRALENLGPTAIKLGQVLACRPDIVGAETAAALSALQDKLTPFSTVDASRVVAQSLGKSVKNLFAEFGEPVAAASIAQVHPALTLDSPPRKVAVKVLRPAIEAAFAKDMAAFAFAARLAERFSAEARRLRFVAVVETLADTVAIELDLRMEAAAASELADRTKADAGFHVPAVDWSRTAQRVLTTEWLDGIKISDGAALASAGHDPKLLAVALVRRLLRSALCDGYFHADMHPGNVFVMADGRIAVVDFGIMGRLDMKTRRFMADVLLGFLQRDYARVARAHIAYGTVSAAHDEALLAQALRAIAEPVLTRPPHEISMAALLQQLFDTTRRFGMQTQPQLLLLQKTMVVVEGVARGLDADFDMWECARPVAEEWIRDQMGPKARLADVVATLKGLAAQVRDWADAGQG